MLKTVLLILTLGYGGEMHLALTETDTLADCEDKAEAVEQVLIGAGYTIEAMRCGETDLKVAPYNHAHKDADMRWHYRVVLNGTSLEDGFTARSVAPGACEVDGEANAYCAISAQGPVAN